MKNKNKTTITITLMLVLFSSALVLAYTPEGPDTLVNQTSTTKSSVGTKMINVSGGTITPVNLTATVQNKRWKAFAGNVTGSYTLDDSSGSTIYDWSLSTITGRVYATRQSGAISWSTIQCADTARLNSESTAMAHTNPDSINDNITKTFNENNHDQFYVGSVSITQDSCYSLNTYVNSVSQSTDFQEVALDASTNVVYATIIDQSTTGYDGGTYDFQMIVPENGAPGYTSATPYYMYVEIGN